MKIHPWLLGTTLAVAATCFQCKDIKGLKYVREDPDCPKVLSISPAGAAFGELVTLTGENFIADNTELHEVLIDGVSIPEDSIVAVPSTTSLQFRVPKGVGSGRVEVRFRNTICEEVEQGSLPKFAYRYTAVMVSSFAGTLNVSNCTNCFSSPEGMVVDQSGNLWVADRLRHVVRKISPSGQFLATVGKIDISDCDPSFFPNPMSAPFNSPTDVAIDASTNNILVTERGSGIIRAIPESASSVSVFSGKCNDFTMNPSPTPCNMATFGSLTNIVSDGKTFYVADAGNTRKISSECTISTINSINPIRCLVINREQLPANGPLFAFDLNTNKVISLSETGVKSNFSTFGLSPGAIVALESDDKGNIFMADQSTHNIYNLSPDGAITLLAGVGAPGSENGSGKVAEFRNPSGLAFHQTGNSNVLYIADLGNKLIRKITLE